MELAINDLGGAGVPLVVLHGLLGTGRNWLGPARKLQAAGHRVVLADLRNHGASPWDDVMDYPAMARDVAELIGRLGDGPVDLLGHSMGGKAALTLALTRPELVRRLIAVDIAPVVYGHRSFADYIDAMRAIDLGIIRRRGDADDALAPAVPDPAMRAFLLQNLESGGQGGFRWRANLDVLAASLPALVGWRIPGRPAVRAADPGDPRGGLAYVGEGAGLAAFGRLFPRAIVETVPQAAHWPHVENPEPFMAILGHFLANG